MSLGEYVIGPLFWLLVLGGCIITAIQGVAYAHRTGMLDTNKHDVR